MRTSQLLLFCFVTTLLALGIGDIAGQDSGNYASGSTSSQTAHYIIFERDATGNIEPVYHTFVQMDTSTLALNNGQYQSMMNTSANPQQRRGVVGVSLVNDRGQAVYHTIAPIETWIRGEFHANNTIDGHFFQPQKGSFVVRVPAIAGTQVVLEESTTGKISAFDPDSISRDRSLRLANYNPPSQRMQFDTNNPNNRVDLLVMGDGYTDSSSFMADYNNFIAEFFNITPYSEYRDYVNVVSHFVQSNTAGASQPPYQSGYLIPSGQEAHPQACGDFDAQYNTSGTVKPIGSTAFDSSFCGWNIWRLLMINTSKVYAAAAASPNWEHIIVIVNENKYGGSGGPITVNSMHAAAIDISQHEYGHSYTQLADEYTTANPVGWFCSDTDTNSSNDCAPNVTDYNGTNRNLVKWAYWYNPVDVPVPTTGGFYYTPALGENQYIGLYEGAFFHQTGYFRPGDQCMMNLLGRPFCFVASEAYALKLYNGWWYQSDQQLIDGIDIIEPGTETPSTETTYALTYPDTLSFSARVLGAKGGNTVKVEWLVNGSVHQTGTVAANSTVGYELEALIPGVNTVLLRVTDVSPILHPNNRNASVSTRQWTVNVASQSYPIELTASGDLSSAAVLPILSWRHQVSAEATEVPGVQYKVFLRKAPDTRILFETFNASDICTGVQCSVSIAPIVKPWGLLTGTYEWWVGAVMPDGSKIWSGGPGFPPATFSVNVPAAQMPTTLTNDPRQGRPVIIWDNDPNTWWVQIWIGGADNGRAYNAWHERNGSKKAFTCNASLCWLEPDINWPSGTYKVWMQFWGPGGFSSGGTDAPRAPSWKRGEDVILTNVKPLPPTGLGVTGTNTNNPTFHWDGMANATWYQVLVEPAPAGSKWKHGTWHLGYDLGVDCGNATGTCTWADPKLDGKLRAGDYVFRVRTWGPGGTGEYSSDFVFTYSGSG